MGTLAPILDRGLASVSERLVDAAGRASLAAVASGLPEEITTFWGLECRLGDPAARADLLLETRCESRGQALLAAGSDLDDLCRASPTWAALRRFARAWSDPEQSFAQHVRNLWLEFDVAAAAADGARQPLLSPCVFFGPGQPNLAADDLAAVVSDAVALLTPAAQPSFDFVPFIRRLAGACLFQVGLMLSRSGDIGRFCVRDLPADEIPGWLVTIGWPGDVGALRHLIRTLAPITRSIAVDLGASGSGLCDTIGLECYMEWLEDDPRQWCPLLDEFEARELLLPAKREGLLAFPGVTPLALEERRGDGVSYANLFRKIHHLKLTVEASGALEQAKAYLALSRPAIRWIGAELRSGWLVE